MMIDHVILVKAIELDDVSRVLPVITGVYILLTDDSVSWETVLGGSVVLGGVCLLPSQILGRPGEVWLPKSAADQLVVIRN